MLTLKESLVIVEKALEKGREMGLDPLTVAVMGADGHLKMLQREDGAAILRNGIASGKAWGAIALGLSSRELGNRFSERHHFMNALITMSHGQFVPVPGGVIIRKNGKIVGSVGISGANSDEDEACAVAGITAAGLEAVI